ncbi:hypothetical protein ACHWQZ_G002900 [Mnemiopsis leidyi]
MGGLLYVATLFGIVQVLSARFTLVDIHGRPITDESKGLLLYNGGTVCDDSFSDNSGTAICRQMGYDKHVTWESHTTWSIQSSYDILLDDVSCDSPDWSSCSYTTQHNCGHSEDVFLACKETPQFSLVDEDGNEITAGDTLGLLLYDDGTVCDDSFNDNSGTAICRFMGFSGLNLWASGYRYQSLQASKEITLDNVDCQSGSWVSCTYSTDHNCGHLEDVFLSCRSASAATEEPSGSFTLVDTDGNSIESGGTLGLLLYNDGTVCDDSFNDNSGTAICRNMGFSGLREWSTGLRFEDLQNSKEIRMDNVDCSGESWDSCSFITDHNCGHSEDVFLSCRGSTDGSTTEEPPQQFKLVDSDGSSIQSGGTLGLLLYNDGTVCDDSFNDNSGTAICRNMGFSGLREWSTGLTFADLQNSKEIKMDNVDCSSGSWDSCSFITDHNCGHNEDVFLSCEGSLIDGEVTEAPQPESTVAAGPETCPECPATPTCPPTLTCPTVTCPELPQSPTCPPQRTCPNCPPTPTCAEQPTCPECPEHPTCPEHSCPPQRTCPACPEHPTTSECPPSPTCPTVSTCPTPRCPAGSYPHEANCALCPANFYNSAVGSTSCLPCPAQSTSKPGSTRCDCPGGSMWSNGRCKRCLGNFAGVNGQCVHCPDGSQAVDGGQSCSCPDGQIWIWGQNLQGACVPCPEGKFKAGDMIQCELCPTKSTSLSGSPVCSCEPGNYWNGEDCVTCSSGSASSDGASECKTCENGTSSDLTVCMCGAGLVWEWAGPSNGSCKPCLSNTYKGSKMQSCQNCPSSSTSSAGSESCDCTAGSYWNGSNCQACVAGSASTDEAIECITCDNGSATNQTECLCKDGMIWQWDGPSRGSCKPCIPNTYKIGKMRRCQSCPSSTSSAGACSCNCLAGNFWNGQSCQECPLGAASADGASECTTCDIGSGANKTECLCEDGTIWEWDDPSNGSCKPCKLNTYKIREMKSCLSCPFPSTSSFGSSSCSCLAGSFWNGQSCQECASGSASPDVATECVTCDTDSVANQTECLCEDGMIWEWDDPSNGSCKPCKLNTYKTREMFSCQICPFPSTSSFGSSSCSCLAGSFWNGQSCQECASGSASPDVATECVTCDIDSSENKTECLCKDGMIWEWDGPSSGSCEPCLADTYKIGKMRSCESCPFSTTSSVGASSCNCLAGNFWNGQSCQECPLGAASADGATECTTCNIGSGANKTECLCEDGMIWEWDDPSNGSCKPCLRNTYKIGNMSRCEECPIYSLSTAGSSHCICQKGTFRTHNNTCVICTESTYFHETAGHCSSCPLGTVPINRHTACSCRAGNYWSNQKHDCVVCPENHYSNDSAVECTQCPIYSVSEKGAKHCQTCPFGEHWKQYSCEKCNEPQEFGNGVFCVSSKLYKDGYTQEIVQGEGLNMTTIILAIAVILGVSCVVLAVLLIKKQKKEKKTPAPSGQQVRYSSVMTPNVEYSDWPGTRQEDAGPSNERPQNEDEKSWCAEWSNLTAGSDENIYSYLDTDRADNLRDII